MSTGRSPAVDAQLARFRAAGDAPLRESPLVTSAFQPYPPHKIGVLHLAASSGLVLADATGCGKTPQALVAFALRHEQDPSLKALVFTTASAVWQWKSAVAKFLVPEVTVGTPLDRPQSARPSYFMERPIPAITLLHYQMLTVPLVEAIEDSLSTCVLILDEAQKAGGVDQAVHRPLLKRLRTRARFCWALSATPYETLDGVYGVYDLVCPGSLGSLKDHRTRYSDRVKIYPKGKGRPFEKTTGLKNLELLKPHLDAMTLRRLPEDMRQWLPPVVFTVRTVTMKPAQQRLYNRILADEVDPRTGDTIDPLVSLTFAQQALSVPALFGDATVPSAKYDELLDYLRTCLADKIIVYSPYVETAEWLVARLRAEGFATDTINGTMTPADREGARLRFKRPHVHPAYDARLTCKEPPCIVPRPHHEPSTNPAPSSWLTDGTGVLVITDAANSALDLPEASTVLFYDLPWSWSVFQQVLGRARRIGSLHETVSCVTLLVEGSVDELRGKVLAHKSSTQKALQTTPFTFDHTSLPVELSKTTLSFLKKLARASSNNLVTEILEIIKESVTSPLVVESKEDKTRKCLDGNTNIPTVCGDLS